ELGSSHAPSRDNGIPVHHLKPTAEMRHAAEARLARYPGFRSLDGAAEATRLPDASVDVVLAAQAFHLVRPRTRAGGVPPHPPPARLARARLEHPPHRRYAVPQSIRAAHP